MRISLFLKLLPHRKQIKFFGSKDRKEQIKQVKMEIEAKEKSEVLELLYHQYKYKVVNGLKINEIES